MHLLNCQFLDQVEATAPVGTILIIEQPVGECGADGTTKTEYFKISHETRSGEREVVG